MIEAQLPGHDQQPEGIVCASCGHFVGAMTRCPHCGAHVTARMTVRVFRYGAVLLATAGLALLYLMATHKTIPIIKIGDIKPTMNFAYVRVSGVVPEEARIYKRGDQVQSVRFTVSDGSGEIPVTAHRAKAQDLIDADQVPTAGDRVTVTGSLSVSAERMGLWLQAPEQLVIERGTAEEMPLGQIGLEQVGLTAVVRGQIVSVTPPRPGSRRPWTLEIKDKTGKQVLTFWQDIYDGIDDKVNLSPGTPVSARVVIGSFREKVQLRLANASDLTFVSGTEAQGGE